MKVALLIDRIWLSQEQPTLRHLSVGLVDQQIDLLYLLPQDPHSRPIFTLSQETVWYRPSNHRFVRDWRLWMLRRSLEEAGIDLLHVLDGSLEGVGQRLGAFLKIPVVCSVWSAAEIAALRGPRPNGPPMGYGVASRTLTERCRQRMNELRAQAHVHTTPPGVYAESSGHVREPLQNPAETLSLLVLGNGEYDIHYQQLFHAIREAGSRLAHAQFFFHSTLSDQHRLWQEARSLGLLDRITFVHQEPEVRQLLVQADALLQPQPLGEARTLLLEAMAASRPVIATTDPLLVPQLTDETALLLANPTPAQWVQAILELIESPARFLSLGQAAAKRVQEHYNVWSQVAKTIELYHQLTAPPTLRFDAAAGGTAPPR